MGSQGLKRFSDDLQTGLTDSSAIGYGGFAWVDLEVSYTHDGSMYGIFTYIEWLIFLWYSCR